MSSTEAVTKRLGPSPREPGRVSVVMVLWNCAPELPKCLRALDVEGQTLPLEVICVDNASADDSVAIAREHRATVVEMGRNAGFPAAVNAGLVHATAPYVLLLNPDVELHPGALRRSLDELTGDPGLGLVGCNLRRVGGGPDWAAARRFRSVSAVALETFGLTRLSKRFDFQYLPSWSRTTSRDVDCVNGAFMLVSADLLRSVGGLDETVFMYLEDQELCRQVWARGRRVRFVADALATHVGGASTVRASLERRNLAYLHRTDADLEMIARRRGPAARLVALVLFALRAVFGLLVGVAGGNSEVRSKYLTALGWLSVQLGGRRPPPPIP